MKLKSLFLLAAFGLLCIPASADPIIIDFEGILSDPGGREYVDEHREDGFILSVDPAHRDMDYAAIMGATRGGNPRGSSNFWWNPLNPPITITLERDGSGEPFSFKSIWLGQIGGADIRPITITGYLSGGGTVTQEIDPAGGTWTQYSINSNFTDLLKVTFNLNPLPPEMPVLRAPSMDDLVLCPVPEPSSLLLLSGGLGLVELFRRCLG